MQDRSVYAYIVASRTRTLYIGVTSNIGVRVLQHRNKAFEGFTADYNCNRLVWYECYDNPSRAIAREKQLKRWIRSKKLALIEKMNPTWIDLSENWGKPLQPLKPDFSQKACGANGVACGSDLLPWIRTELIRISGSGGGRRWAGAGIRKRRSSLR